MEHHRLRKYRGAETWARVRAAYVAGEPAPSVARRFDVGLANLRRRAMKEGWTRNQVAEALDRQLTGERIFAPGEIPSPLGAEFDETPLERRFAETPEVAIMRAFRRAARLLSAGHAAEAALTMRAAERLANLAEVVADPETRDRWR